MEAPARDCAANLPQLYALATRIEGKSQYNAAKLVRAAADAVARRAAFDRGLPTDLEGIASDLDDVLGALRDGPVDAAIVDALGRARQALLAGKQTMLPDFPDAYVCRRCGESSLGLPERPCKTCGAWPTTYQRFPAIYWLEEFHPHEAVKSLRNTPVVVDALLIGLSEREMTAVPPDGGWSIRQVVTHLRDADSVLNTRVKLITQEDNPNLAFAAVSSWTVDAAAKPGPVEEIVKQYHASRRDSLERLEKLPPADWWRTGQHPEFGTLTLLAQVSYFAAHELTHLRQIHNAREHVHLAR